MATITISLENLAAVVALTSVGVGSVARGDDAAAEDCLADTARILEWHGVDPDALDLLSDVAEMCPAATVSEVLPFVRASHALCETNHTAKSENKGDFHPDAVDPPRDPDRTPAEVMDPQ